MNECPQCRYPLSDRLDYTIDQDEFGQWQVWTPDRNGACIGTGRTKTEAIKSTIIGASELIKTLSSET